MTDPNAKRRRRSRTQGGKGCGNCKRKCLAEMQNGEEGRIEAIGDEIREKIVSMGVRPGKRCKIQNKQPLKGPVIVSVGKNVMTSMSRRHARQIEIAIDSD